MRKLTPSSRRDLLAAALATVMIGAISNRAAWAGDAPDEIRNWLLAQIELKEAVQSGQIDELEWRIRVLRLNNAISGDDLISYLNIDELTRRFRFRSRLAEFVDPILPDAIKDATLGGNWFIRVFGMRRGYGLLPHVHNDMVSAHIIIAGNFHVRTHDRVRDLDDAVVLLPVEDDVFGVGKTIAMSDTRENQHWLVADSHRAMTIDIAVHDVHSDREHRIKAGTKGTILVDPSLAPERDGSIVAPVLTFEQACAKFAC